MTTAILSLIGTVGLEPNDSTMLPVTLSASNDFANAGVAMTLGAAKVVRGFMFLQ
jgi:hypothetical protein